MKRLNLNYARWIFQSVLMILMLGYLPGKLMAGAFEDGKVAYNNQDYSRAINLWRPLAEQGDVRAQYRLGVMFRAGQNRIIDVKEFYKRSEIVQTIDTASVSANEEENTYRSSGESDNSMTYDVSEDDKQAFRWFLMAANRGHELSQMALGDMYEFGQGVDGDILEAIKWWKKAGLQGNVDAQKRLGFIYQDGELKNIKESVRWYTLAAEQGDSNAQSTLALIYSIGDGVPQDDLLSMKWKKRAAKQGNASAQVQLGFCYLTGQGVPQDFVLAHMWFNIAASAESSDRSTEFARKTAIEQRNSLATEMTSSQIEAAQKLAREWKPIVEARRVRK